MESDPTMGATANATPNILGARPTGFQDRDRAPRQDFDAGYTAAQCAAFDSTLPTLSARPKSVQLPPPLDQSELSVAGRWFLEMRPDR